MSLTPARASMPDNSSVASLTSKSLRSRKSILARLNRKSRPDVAHEVATAKPVFVTLKLSSPSFLDACTSTTISRTDPWQGVHKVADIKWPKLVPIKTKASDSNGVLVQIKGGKWLTGEEVLKPSSVSFSTTTYKFSIPGYSHHLKWKQVGKTHWCTTSAVQGPIAIFHPAEGTRSAKLAVYETLHDKQDTRPLMSHNGVSTLLLDYLLVTATILWMVVKKYDGPASAVVAPPLPSARSATSESGSNNGSKATSEQWRKIAYGEPMFPKKRSPSSASRSSSEQPPVTPGSSIENVARLATGSKYQRESRSRSSSMSSFHANDQPQITEEPEEEQEEPTAVQRPTVPRLSVPDDNSTYFPPRGGSPSAESVFFPLTPSSAPSHTYIDPSFYNGRQENVPPVPALPLPYAAERELLGSSVSAPNSATSSQRFLRELPMPPPTPSAVSDSAADHLYRNDSPMTPTSPNSVRSRRLPVPPPSSSPAASSAADMLSRQASTSTLSKKRQSSYGRTLPPPPGAPADPASDEQKTDSRWQNRFTMMSRQSVFELPPPAYNTLFGAPALPGSIPPIPPVPPLPSSSSDTETTVAPP
ncbi:hypothetical protein DL96DRAFT_1603303 [Flagelloscypha sp. PMI_526]|nr:hypothetical protein DL96DRAFT_1603303 [Flagelloscypha sp. PMI_526]